MQQRNLLLMDIAAEIHKCLFYFHFEPFFHGYHVYQHIWTPVVAERYSCIRNIDNVQDKHAIAIVIEERINSHIPVCL